MQHYLETLEKEFKHNDNAIVAAQQKAYMRNQFEYFGLKTDIRREVQKPFLVKNYLPEKTEVSGLIKTLWNLPQREFQHFGQELAFKYLKNSSERDIELYEYMVINKSWWDTVDFIATKLIGTYFKTYPEQRYVYIKKWLQSGNIWLQRCAIIFQLKYKNGIDTQLLSMVITSLLGSKEFFINKAIGWILREYSRTNPAWVTTFVQSTALSPLSKREALRLLLK